MILIEAINLKKEYRVGKLVTEVLKGIDVRINQGDFASIVGPSGSGKTTLLYTLGGIEKYTKGNVRLFNKNLEDYTDKEKAILRSKKNWVCLSVL